jgi:hypothetical protein
MVPPGAVGCLYVIAPSGAKNQRERGFIMKTIYEQRLDMARKVILAHNLQLREGEEGVDSKEFFEELRKIGGISDSALNHCSWEDLQRCGLPRLLAKHVCEIFRDNTISYGLPDGTIDINDIHDRCTFIGIVLETLNRTIERLLRNSLSVKDIGPHLMQGRINVKKSGNTLHDGKATLSAILACLYECSMVTGGGIIYANRRSKNFYSSADGNEATFSCVITDTVSAYYLLINCEMFKNNKKHIEVVFTADIKRDRVRKPERSSR